MSLAYSMDFNFLFLYSNNIVFCYYGQEQLSGIGIASL